MSAGSVPSAGAQPDVRPEADWALATRVLDARDPSHWTVALASHTDVSFVNPYLAAFGAIGLADAARVTGDARYADAAWQQAEWHAGAMDADGYVTDYRVDGGTLVSTGTADATDAYAGMFLLTVEAAQCAAPDAARLAALAPKLRLGVQAIRSTLRPDGLTGAKPGWDVAYLMNDAEAFAGLQAAARLGRVLGDRQLARDAIDAARRVRRAVARLWNPTTGAFDWAVHGDGVREPTRWASLYPDAVSQVWAVRYGLVRGSRADALLTQFLAAHPNAHDPDAIDLIDGTLTRTGSWPGLALALRAIDPDAPRRYVDGTLAASARSGAAWPYSVQTAGEILAVDAVDAVDAAGGAGCDRSPDRAAT